ncbi:hypothetical protein VZG28_04980 [Synechococcus elongatus IITB4]|uniref:hypothetical protein n=1 Tax=Synechococcus elongatus TaxID=32046 RepID=UPI0030CB5217
MAEDRLFLVMRRFRDPEKARRRSPQFVYVNEKELPVFMKAGFGLADEIPAADPADEVGGISWRLATNGYENRAPLTYYLGDELAAELNAPPKKSPLSFLNGFTEKLGATVEIAGQQVPAWAIAAAGLAAVGATAGGIVGLTNLGSDRGIDRQPQQY